MKKKIISVLAVLAMLVFACGTAFSAEFSIDLKGIKDTIKKDVKNAKSGKNSEGTTGTAKAAAANTEPNSEDDFDWKVNDDLTEITITKYKGARTDVVIPATIQDVPVTCIGKEAFYQKSSIKSVVIPKGVKKIEANAFRECYYYSYGAYGLESVTLPSDISIGAYAFSGNNLLKTVVLSENTILEEGAFSNCGKLESVTLPEGLKIIPNGCFSYCKSLANINFPSTLKYIGDRAFTPNGDTNTDDYCPFTSVELPEGLEYIGFRAFRSNASISVSLPKTLKWVSYPIISGDSISTITIAEGCAPKAIGGKEGMDGRDLIKGTSIDKSLKLQKQLAALKLTPTGYLCSDNSKYKNNGKCGYYSYYFTDTGKALYDDLLSYGFTEKEAKEIMGI